MQTFTQNENSTVSSDDQPLVSVITACYQQGHFLGDCIHSVQRQDYPHVEHIIVNDGSTDTTEQVATSQPDRKIRYFFQSNRGQATARQTGLERANGHYILLLDSDDALLPGAISRLVRLAGRMPSERLGLVIGQSLVTDANLKPNGKIVNRKVAITLEKMVKENLIGGIGGVLMRSADLHRLGGLDVAGRPGAEDWDLWIRYFRAGATFQYCQKAVSLYRQTGVSYSRNPLKMFESVRAVLETCRAQDLRLASFNASEALICDTKFEPLLTRQALYHLGIALALESGSEVLDRLVDGVQPEHLAMQPDLLLAVHAGALHALCYDQFRFAKKQSAIDATSLWLLASKLSLDRQTFEKLHRQLSPEHSMRIKEIINLAIRRLNARFVDKSQSA